MFPRTLLSMAVVAAWWLPEPMPQLPAADKPTPDGNATIRAQAGSSDIVITTTSRLAGAIHSLTWAGKEFIDSRDHGRQLQSACSFDCGTFKDYWAESYNPTEAGSRADGAREKSSSRLVSMSFRGSQMQSTTRMAFWLAPGEKSSGHPARNDKVLSEHLLAKRVRIGYKDWPHAVEYEVSFHVPKGEKHTYAQFEALTGYMPEGFRRFWKYDRSSGELKPLDDGPGEQECPVVLATPSGQHAMGVYSPDQPSKRYEKAGYGRFRFQAEKVVKWNCVFRLRDAEGVPAGKHSFRVFVVVGDLKNVRATLCGLCKAFGRP